MRCDREVTFLILLIMVIPSTSFMIGNIHQPNSDTNQGLNSTYFIPIKQSGVVLSGFKEGSAVNSTMSMNILVTLAYSNNSRLDSYLSQLQNPSSKFYHKYLTQGQFISEFSPSRSEYDSYLRFFENNGLNIGKTYADRLSIAITSDAGQLEKVFHTNITYFNSTKGTFYAPNSPLYLGKDLGSISGISGLSDQFKAKISPMFLGSGSSQYLYGSDLQTAYQLNKIYQSTGYPTGETVATILWSGTDSGTPVGPFVPSDISTYFNNNQPSGEPKSKFYGLPVAGAPLPGSSAAQDTTGANIESTLDLEMAGSTAPGATIVEVYGPQPYTNYLDEAFAEILNPSYNTTIDSALSHVVAISNSWGSGDMYDSAWAQYEQEAAARGITVLASSGDNGNTNSPYPSYPATVGYNGYGSLAVGGTQTILGGSQSSDGSGTTGILSQAVWYNTPSSGDGSQGGVSTVYQEPSWQKDSPDANGVITGASAITGVNSGRGTPDIAAVGANMLVYLSSVPNGGTGYYELWGTSIASPLDAGLFATIDSYLNAPEGFVNPFIYSIGQEQYQGLYNGPPPFYFIHNGSNGEFGSANGYNLVDGWGSINAYNFALAQKGTGEVTFSESGLSTGVKWYVNLSDGTSLSSTASSISVLLKDGSYTYSASSALVGFSHSSGDFSVNGSPVGVNIKFTYFAYKTTFTESGLPSGQWYVNISGKSLSASSGTSITYELPNGTYNYSVATGFKNYAPSPSSGSFSVSGSNSTVAEITFSAVEYTVKFSESGLTAGLKWQIGISGITYQSTGNSLTVALQNGTYSYSAICISNSSYSSNGGSFVVDGTSLYIAVAFREAYMIRFLETGLPSGYQWTVTFDGEINSSYSPSAIGFSAPNGSYSYIISGLPGFHPVVSSGIVTVSGNNVNITATFIITTYNVVLQNAGLPMGKSWFVNFTAGPGNYGNLKLSSSGSSVSVALSNGTYLYEVSTADKSYTASGSGFTVQGSSVSQTIYFYPIAYPVVFHETGLPTGKSWNITIGNSKYQSTASSQTIYEINGTYTYSVGASPGYHPVTSSGSFTVNGAGKAIYVSFEAYTYNISFFEYNLPHGTQWWVNLSDGQSLSSNSNTNNGSLSNGTYYFYAGTNNKSWVSTNSYFDTGHYELYVSGYSYTYYLSFQLMTYNITFIESGLSPGAYWSGYMVNSYGFAQSNSPDLFAYISNGSYQINFTAWQNGVEYTQPGYNVTVNGGNEIFYVTFHRYYVVTFLEAGLPAGQNGLSWGVNFSGLNYEYYGVSEFNLSALDGTYSVFAINNTRYYGVFNSPNVIVAGSNITVTVNFKPYAFITLNIYPVNATILIDGISENVQYGGYLNLSVLPGIHHIVVYEKGYTTYYKNTTLSGGRGITLQVSLEPKTTVRVTNDNLAIGIGAAIAVPSTLIAYFLLKKRK